MKKYLYKIVNTADGSDTITLINAAETFHSKFGALTESMHIFINSGLMEIQKQTSCVSILEVGFGTGLNALLTLKHASDNNLNVDYYAVEPFPLPEDIYSNLNYPGLAGVEKDIFKKLHRASADTNMKISNNFTLYPLHEPVQSLVLKENTFNLVYFDAFNPDLEPDMWQEEVFEKIFRVMKKNSILVTYSAKGLVKRNMQHAGFLVEKLPGPPGKREIIRAVKK